MLYVIIATLLLVTVLLVLLERERQTKAKHRASTARLLDYIAFLPTSNGLEENRLARWVG